MTREMRFADKASAHAYLLNQWREGLKAGNIQRAIEIDFIHYNHLVKPVEDREYWDRWQHDSFALRTAIAGEFATSFPTRARSAAEAGSGRFLVVNHNYSGLAHETQLSRNLHYLRQNGHAIDFDVAYLFGGDDDTRRKAAALYGVDAGAIRFLGASNYLDAGKKLDLLTRQQPYASLVYPSIFIMAYWMSLLCAHGNQKFLQLKYFPLHAGRMSGWGCGRKNASDQFVVHGHAFTQLSILDLLAGQQRVDSAVAAAPGAALAFGSISRPEKVANGSYNDFVLRLLERHPQAQYLYAGRPDSVGVIPEAVRAHSRSVPLGWVDPAESIRRFSIYVEPFPWGGGDMTLLALQAGLPYLTLGSEENRTIGLYDHLRLVAQPQADVLDFSFCCSVEEMESRFAALASDAGLRNALGAAWRRTLLDYRPPDADAWMRFLLE